ncbi:hypothetical protein [Butyricimonas paravirosa]|nr:hypothetical protein [Butyricimonas paravirosa]MCQ4872970.1 hypothetical protein [Butyricimonas paravirosa]
MRFVICFFVSLLCVVKAGAQDAAVINGVVEDKSLNRCYWNC